MIFLPLAPVAYVLAGARQMTPHRSYCRGRRKPTTARYVLNMSLPHSSSGGARAGARSAADKSIENHGSCCVNVSKDLAPEITEANELSGRVVQSPFDHLAHAKGSDTLIPSDRSFFFRSSVKSLLSIPGSHIPPQICMEGSPRLPPYHRTVATYDEVIKGDYWIRMCVSKVGGCVL
jgi:hypothetical protein